MPLHRYRCGSCKKLFEEIQKFSDDPLTKCEKCGGKLEKQRGIPSFHLKGEGWHATDYPSSSAPEEDAAPSDDTNWDEVRKKSEKAVMEKYDRGELKEG